MDHESHRVELLGALVTPGKRSVATGGWCKETGCGQVNSVEREDKSVTKNRKEAAERLRQLINSKLAFRETDRKEGMEDVGIGSD